MWLCKWTFCVERYGQWSQAKGFSPVWVRICVFKLSIWAARKGQWGQPKGFSPVWVHICRVRWVLLMVVYGQKGHWWILVPAVRLFPIAAAPLLAALWWLLPSLACWGGRSYLSSSQKCKITFLPLLKIFNTNKKLLER